MHPKLTPQQKESYKKDGKCFKCGNKTHTFYECSLNNKEKTKPKVNEINVETQNIETNCALNNQHDLFRVSGLLQNELALFLFDDASTHNIIDRKLAHKLKLITSNESLKVEGAFDQTPIECLPLINKIQIQIQNYKDKLEFIVAPLKHTYVIIGMPWRRQMDPIISYIKNTITFKHKKSDITIQVGKEGKSIPLVQHISIKKHTKKDIHCFLILPREHKNDASPIDKSRL